MTRSTVIAYNEMGTAERSPLFACGFGSEHDSHDSAVCQSLRKASSARKGS